MKAERFKEIKEVFLRVLELEPAGRAAYLDEACAGDPALRNEVEGLLTALAREPGFLESAVLPGGAKGMAEALAEAVLSGSAGATHLSSSGAPAPPIAGQENRRATIAGRYAVLEEVGRGAMGVVYRARDPLLERDVAVKVLRDSLHSLDTDPIAVARFQQEARSLARLAHPNIVSVFDSGMADGSPFIVMELLDGRDLSLVMAGPEPLSTAARFQIMIDVCEGLAHAHGQGIVHRDVKPRNIHVLPGFRAKLTDFGMAKIAARGETLTATGRVVGTPAYMAPEQIEGRQVDLRSDLFSTGVVLYKLFTGNHPFHGDTDSAIMYNIITKDPPPLDAASVPDAPHLERVVRHALEKDPARRYQDASDLASDIRKLADGSPVGVPDTSAAAYKPKGSPRMSSKARRTVRPPVYVALAMAVLAAVSSFYPALRDRVSRPAAAPRVREPASLKFSEQGIAVYDQFGKSIWNWPFEQPLNLVFYGKSSPYPRLYRFMDVDGDGLKDLFFVAIYSAAEPTPSEVFLFRHDGTAIRRIRTVSRLYFDEKEYSIFEADFVKFWRTKQGSDRVLLCLHTRESPAVLWLMDRSGAILGEYANFGHLRWPVLWDADGDGDEEIVVAGVNDDSKRPVVVVLEPDAFGHAPALEEGPPYRAQKGRPEQALYYVALSNLDPDLRDAPIEFAQLPTPLSRSRLKVEVTSVNDSPIYFHFTSGMACAEAEFGTSLKVVFEKRRAENPALETEEQKIKRYLTETLYNDGEGWTSTPPPFQEPKPQP